MKREAMDLVIEWDDSGVLLEAIVDALLYSGRGEEIAHNLIFGNSSEAAKEVFNELLDAAERELKATEH